jgi:hypothetical protein
MGATSITPPIQSYLDKKHWETIKRQHCKSVVDDITLLTLERLQKAADAVANGHSIDDSVIRSSSVSSTTRVSKQ